MLRHTYCTNLILAGVAPVTVKDLMGHASIRITLDIYTHITEEFKEKVGVLGNLKYSTYEMKYWIETVVKSLQGLVTKRGNSL